MQKTPKRGNCKHINEQNPCSPFHLLYDPFLEYLPTFGETWPHEQGENGWVNIP